MYDKSPVYSRTTWCTTNHQSILEQLGVRQITSLLQNNLVYDKSPVYSRTTWCTTYQESILEQRSILEQLGVRQIARYKITMILTCSIISCLWVWSSRLFRYITTILMAAFINRIYLMLYNNILCGVQEGFITMFEFSKLIGIWCNKFHIYTSTITAMYMWI